VCRTTTPALPKSSDAASNSLVWNMMAPRVGASSSNDRPRRSKASALANLRTIGQPIHRTVDGSTTRSRLCNHSSTSNSCARPSRVRTVDSLSHSAKHIERHLGSVEEATFAGSGVGRRLGDQKGAKHGRSVLHAQLFVPGHLVRRHHACVRSRRTRRALALATLRADIPGSDRATGSFEHRAWLHSNRWRLGGDQARRPSWSSAVVARRPSRRSLSRFPVKKSTGGPRFPSRSRSRTAISFAPKYLPRPQEEHHHWRQRHDAGRVSCRQATTPSRSMETPPGRLGGGGVKSTFAAPRL